LAIIIIASATIFSIGGIILYYFIEGHAFSERFGVTFKEMYTGWMCFTTVFAATISLQKMYKAAAIMHKFLYLSCFGILSAVTLLNQSRAGIIGLFAALIIMSLYWKKNIIMIALIIAMFFLVPGLKERIEIVGIAKITIRPQIYRLTGEVIKDYPVAGIGYGGEIYGNSNLVDLEKYQAKLPQKYWQDDFIRTTPHNTFLDVAVRTGLVGLALFCGILLTAFWMLGDVFWRRREEFFRSWSICLFACLTAYLIQAFLNDAMYGAQGVILYFHLAMIGILWNLARKKPSAV